MFYCIVLTNIIWDFKYGGKDGVLGKTAKQVKGDEEGGQFWEIFRNLVLKFSL